jgi:BirA family transcriptional regulator, biotin operon repressor / biotin---[acetyl-CoA-carboxylase] ligase
MKQQPFLNADQIRAASFIRHVEIHDTLGSTNDRAAELARDPDIDLPALVAARHQTAGRGRGANSWLSADGALTFSVLLDPAALGISTANWPQLALATAVAICDALGKEMDGPDKRRLGIKWPNDVMLDGGKVCGILLESPGGAAPEKDRLIIGIGVNVNNSWHSAPRAAGPHGVALCDATSRKHELQVVLTNTLNAIQKRINQLATNDPQLPSAWQKLCWLTELNVEVQAKGNWISGICLGIDVDGALLIEDVFKTHRVHSGTVRVRR